MSARPYLLGLVALGLAGIAVWDYWPMPPAPQTASRTAPNVGSVPALNPLSRLGAADFAALFDHPLFDPSRNKPVAEAPVSEATPAPVATIDAPTPVQPSGPAQPVLMGTVSSPWPGGVYLGDDAGGPVVFLRPGQASLGLHLEEVRSDSAIFMGPDGEVTLTLRKTDLPGATINPGGSPNSNGPSLMPTNP